MKFKTVTLLRITAYCALALAILQSKEREGIGVVTYAVIASLLGQYFLRHIVEANWLRLALLVFAGGVGSCIGGHNFGGSVMTQPSNVLLGMVFGAAVWYESNKAGHQADGGY